MLGEEEPGGGPGAHVDEDDALSLPHADDPPHASAAPPRPDGRGIHRIPIRLVVSRRGKSAPLGVTRDLSLRGVFIETQAPLPIGTVVPLAIELDAGAPPLLLEAEVMRVDELGMGLAFTASDPSATRRLRRWIVDRTSVLGTQRQVEQLHDRNRSVAPIVEPARIAELLAAIREARAAVLVIPVDRLVRDDARIEALGPEELLLATRDPSLLAGGDEVFALAQIGYVSYSFALRVRRVEPRRAGSLVVAELPTRVVYSERRGKDRAPAAPGTTVRWPAPWDAATTLEHAVLEHNAHGLSFRSDEAGCLLAPGAPLPGAVLARRGAPPTALPGAEVRHLTRVVEPDGATWLRVGVAFGPELQSPRTEVVARDAPGPLGWIKRALAKARTVLSYGLHKGKARLTGDAGDSRRVTFHGAHRLVGLLDRTRSDERVRCPLVIVVPGFGGRKEQMAFLAGTLVEGFARQHHDVAVLRFDGSNNIGESGRDARERTTTEDAPALRYTVSGLVDDVLAALAWARHNDLVDPTHLVLVSASMGSIGVRHVLTRSEAADVGLWVSYMGAADAIDAIRLVSGNIDLHAYWQRGQRLGIVSLAGLLTDGDRFWADLQRLDLGDLAAAERELAQIRADVVWLYGRHDAYMDPRRVRRVMSVPPPPGARRELVEVDGGHLPKTGEEAVAQFVSLTRRIWQHVNHAPMEPFTPSLGRLAAQAEAEWRRVRRARPADRGAWWKSYLLDPNGLGFDVLELGEPYRALMDRQAELVAEGARAAAPALPVLDLGAGTGNLARRLLARGVARVVVSDLVPEALAAARDKLAAQGVPADRFETRVVDADGAPLVAVRRFLAGDLASPRALAERVPGLHRPSLERLLDLASDGVHAAMRGFDQDLPALARAHRLSPPQVELLADLGALARVVRAELTPEAAASKLTRIPAAVLSQGRGLPEADRSVSAVAMSLLLSYLDHPDDALAEAHRVLVPGGRLVVSSLVPDYDSSRLWVSMAERFQTMPDDELPRGVTRDTLIASARQFVGHAAELFRLAEEGLFRFYDAPALLALVRRRGFVDARAELAFGDPPQAVIVTCRRP